MTLDALKLAELAYEQLGKQYCLIDHFIAPYVVTCSPVDVIRQS